MCTCGEESPLFSSVPRPFLLCSCPTGCTQEQYKTHSRGDAHVETKICTSLKTNLTKRIRRTARDARCGSQLPRHHARLLTCCSRATLTRWVSASMPGAKGSAMSSSNSKPSSSCRPACTRPAAASDLCCLERKGYMLGTFQGLGT